MKTIPLIQLQAMKVALSQMKLELNQTVIVTVSQKLSLSSGLKWGVPPGGGYGSKGDLLFFVEAFGV